jgi:hypothetical protein
MKHKFFSVLIACVAWLSISTSQTSAQANPSKCVSLISKRLETVGTADFDFNKARQIIKEFDFGKASEFVNDAGKKAAFQRIFTSMSEFIDLAPNDISGKAMKGYTRFCGGIIRSTGADFVADLKKVFGEPNFDGPGFNKVMEQLDGTGVWKTQTEWESPAGLTYGTAPDLSQGHRISHVFNHTIPDPAKPQHSIFSVERKDVLGLVDEGWVLPTRYHPLKPDGTPDERVWIANMGKQVGTAGETHLKIVVSAPGSSDLITAFPFIP